jgi:hypothetical protein
MSLNNTPTATDANSRPLNVGDQVSIPVVVTEIVSGSGPSASVDATTLYSSTSVSVEGSDLGASSYDAQSTQAPNQSVSPQALTRTGLPVQAGDHATVIGVITSISPNNGVYGPQSQVTLSTQGSGTSLTVFGGDISGNGQSF